MSYAVPSCGYHPTRVCDGCTVPGDGPHHCTAQPDPFLYALCRCAVQPDCAGWEPATEPAGV